MKKIFTILILSSLFAGELEVEGDLKVSGNIDAQNNPIKNVGVPQELTDAINGNVLQDALRDDTDYEVKIINVWIKWSTSYSGYLSKGKWLDLEEFTTIPIGSTGSDELYNHINDFPAHVADLFNEGWILHSINGSGEGVSWWIFKKPIEE